MRNGIVGVAVLLIGTSGCGKDRSETAVRDSSLASVDSSYALNDRPAAPPASAPGARPSAPSPAPAPAPSPAPAPAPKRGTVTLAAGSILQGALDKTITSRTSKVGDKAHLTISSDVKNAAGQVVVPAGSTVELTITAIESASDKSKTGKLTLQVTGLSVRGGDVPIQAEVSSVTSSLKGRSVGTSEAAKVGVGAAAGAVAGRIIGGDKTGTIIGAVVGAAAGAAVAVETANRDVVVEAGSIVGITLKEPLRVTAG